MSTKPFALLETSTTLEIIIVLKITSMLVGCDSSVTTESSTIFPPSLCSSLLCTKFGCRSKVGLHFVEIKKGHHQMRHYLPVGFQTKLVQILIFSIRFKCLPNNLSNLLLVKLPLLDLEFYLHEGIFHFEVVKFLNPIVVEICKLCLLP